MALAAAEIASIAGPDEKFVARIAISASARVLRMVPPSGSVRRKHVALHHWSAWARQLPMNFSMAEGVRARR